MKAKDFIDIINYTQAFKEPKEKRSRKEKTPTFAELLIQAKRSHDEYDKAMEDLQKLYKKEDKKDDKKDGWEGLSFIKKFTILMMTVPLVLFFEWIVLFSAFGTALRMVKP